MKFLSVGILFVTILSSYGQSKEQLLVEVSDNACKCIDSIKVYNKNRKTIAKEISNCIDKQVLAYQLGSQLVGLIPDGKVKKRKKINVEVTLDTNRNAQAYKTNYFEIERHLMNNCKSIKEKIAAEDELTYGSMSNDSEALDFYYKGIDASKAQEFDKAIDYFKRAVSIDSIFAFCWDNLGLAYRKSGNYEKAIKAYKTSIQIEPSGLMPRQNLAAVYEYKKEYENAIAAYEELASLDTKNPEVYYGKGRLYAVFLGDFEKGLSNMCIAYNLYTEMKSSYRADAEQMINFIFGKMKAAGNEKRFDEILKEYNINRN
jgi:tetratricopeptide (TPR) repeat protein